MGKFMTTKWYSTPTFKKWFKVRFYLPALFGYIFSKKILLSIVLFVKGKAVRQRLYFYIPFIVGIFISVSVFNRIIDARLYNAFWQAHPKVSIIGGEDLDGQRRTYLERGAIYGFRNPKGEKLYDVVLGTEHVPLNFYYGLLFFNNIHEAERAGFKSLNTREEMLDSLSWSEGEGWGEIIDESKTEWGKQGLTKEEFLNAILDGRVERQ